MCILLLFIWRPPPFLVLTGGGAKLTPVQLGYIVPHLISVLQFFLSRENYD